MPVRSLTASGCRLGPRCVSGLFFDAVSHREFADPHSAVLTDTSMSACATSSSDDLRREVLHLFVHWHPMMDFSPTRRPAYSGTNIVTLPLSAMEVTSRM